MSDREKSLLGDVTPEVVAEAAELLASARYGALASVGAEGFPQASRVGTAMLGRFTPLILVSALAAHTAALKAESRCSLLVGEVGKGDPLAHARVTIKARAREIGRADVAYGRARELYLAAQPKAQLYVDLPDFTFMALEPMSVSYVAGFGRAYMIEGGWLD